MKKKILIFLPVLVIGLVSFQNVNDERYFQIVKNLDIFATLFKEVNAHYVDEINPNELIETGIAAMLSTLDPYTTYIPEDDIEDYLTLTTGEYGGIGALVHKKDGVSTIVLPYEGSPADSAGLKIGDQIVQINGIDLFGKTSTEISKLLKGQVNTELTLTVKRFNQEPFEVSLKRERIKINNVPYAGMATDDIGYIRLTDFTTQAGREVGKSLKDLKDQGATKIILDLRGNPGGLLDEAVNVSNVFIDKGKEVVSTRGKLDSWTKKYYARKGAVDVEIPLVVLVDNGSASASEIVAGVMQDYDRGVLIGRKTYGKGLVQQTRPLAYNSQLKVTTAKYYIPSGRCIQAIDYSNRNEDGSVGKIPDSLKTTFTTAIGRPVYDGGGIDPDIDTDQIVYAPITHSLIKNDLLFHYATEYYYSNESVESAKQYDFTEDDYTGFTEWISDKEYDYTTNVERDIDRLIASAKKEKYYSDISDILSNLKTEVTHTKEEDLRKFMGEISDLLEQEISSRYYLQKGMIESTFNKDPDILKAIEVLGDTAQYNKILSVGE